MFQMVQRADGELTSRERLVDAAVRYVADHGVGDMSLRQLATGIGTSHRMLIYHFGSKEALLVEVVRQVEEAQRAALAELTESLGAEVGPIDVMRALWSRLIDPSLAPYERLFFEVYGRALQGDPTLDPLLTGVVDAWLPQLTDLNERAGFPPEAAADHARLQVAVTRGLLLDLLATSDAAAVTAAADRFAAMLVRETAS